ncbi:MAG: DinB family protein [Flavobacteriales bacterium]|nr:DinB family protein [Flavobacteriales bacterium]
MSKLKEIDMTQSFEYNGIKFNSAYWVVGHIAWSENMLLIRGTGGKRVRLPWLKSFEMGAKYEHTLEMPSIKEIIDAMKLIHQTAKEHLKTLDLADLDKPNTLDFEFSGDKSIRMIIQHAARHEASHAGHLGWLCKMHGVKTF